MVPNLRACKGNPVVDVAGMLLHPLGLFAMLAIWGLLDWSRPSRGSELIWRLLVLLTRQSFALAAFLLPVTFIVVIFGENPSRVIEAIQYVAIAGAALTVFLVLRKTRHSPREPEVAGESDPTARQGGGKASRRSLVAILIAAFGIFFFSTGSFFGSHTSLGIFRVTV